MKDKQLYDNMNGAATELRSLIADIRKDPKKFLNVRVSILVESAGSSLIWQRLNGERRQRRGGLDHHGVRPGRVSPAPRSRC